MANSKVRSEADKAKRLGIYELMREVERRLLKGSVDWDWAKLRLQAIIVGRDEVEDRQKPKRDLAEERRQWFEKWYKKVGPKIVVSKPAVSNREFVLRMKMNRTLFYRPATSAMSYDAFMTAVGQAEHWTVTHEDRHKIKWEEAKDGYWFWAEVAADCPRTGTSWNDLSTSVYLLALEEYAIVRHVYKAETNNLLDRRTCTWLRTRFETDFGSGALSAGGGYGQVGIDGWRPESLSVPDSDRGGRLAEVV